MGLESSSALTTVVPEFGLVEHWFILREEQKSRVEKKYHRLNFYTDYSWSKLIMGFPNYGN